MKKKNTRREVIKTSLRYRMEKIADYLLGWIANLGVVPLFLFCAFLLAPALRNLFALLVFVTLVFETIKLLLVQQYSLKLNNRPLFLTIKRTSVKVTTLFLPFIWVPLLHANNKISLHTGEIYQISLPANHHYHNSSPRVIKTKLLVPQGVLIVKALHSGQATITILGKKRTKFYFNVTALPAPINTINEINKYHALIHKFKKLPRLQSYQLSPTLKRLLLSRVIKSFFHYQIFDFICNWEEKTIFCIYDTQVTLAPSLKNYLTHNFQIKFARRQLHKHQLYQLKIELLLLENAHNQNIALGIDTIQYKFNSLQSNLHDFKVFLQQQNIDTTTIAQQTLVMPLNKSSSFSLGSNLAYENIIKTSDQQEHSTKWKFVGLKMNFKLIIRGGLLYIKYKNSFSQPSGSLNDNITTQQGIAPIHQAGINRLFEIGYRANSQSTQSIPLLNKIPILHYLFSTHNNNNTYKKIIALVTTTPYYWR